VFLQVRGQSKVLKMIIVEDTRQDKNLSPLISGPVLAVPASHSKIRRDGYLGIRRGYAATAYRGDRTAMALSETGEGS
jgi:hypothetical protein